jgi:allantoin racemase
MLAAGLLRYSSIASQHSSPDNVMPRILVLNANTTAAVTDLVAAQARAVLGPAYDCIPATARFGARYISCEAAYAIAGHSALDALAEAGPGYDAVMLACFGDPGIFALKEVSAVPVVGLAEASMVEASVHGRYAIVTGGVLWKTMLTRLASALGTLDQIASIRPITLTGDQIAAAPDAAMHFLAEEVRSAVERDGARAVILGGAALAGLAARIAPQVSVPVIDSVHAGARVTALRAQQVSRTAHTTSAAAGGVNATPTVGIGTALARLLDPQG